MKQNRARIGLFELNTPELAKFLRRSNRTHLPVPWIHEDTCVVPGVLAEVRSDTIFEVMTAQYKQFKSNYGALSVALANYRFAVVSYNLEGYWSKINETTLSIYDASDLNNIKLEKEIKSDLIKNAAEHVKYQFQIGAPNREERRWFTHLFLKTFPDQIHLAIVPSFNEPPRGRHQYAVIVDTEKEDAFKVEIHYLHAVNIIGTSSFIFRANCSDHPLFKMEIDFEKKEMKSRVRMENPIKTIGDCIVEHSRKNPTSHINTLEDLKKTEEYKKSNYQDGDLDGLELENNQRLYSMSELGNAPFRLGYPTQVTSASLINKYKKKDDGYPILQLKSGEILLACQPGLERTFNGWMPQIDRAKPYSLKLFDPKSNKLIFDKPQQSSVYCSSVADAGFFLFSEKNAEVTYYGDISVLFDFNKLFQLLGLHPNLVSMILDYAALGIEQESSPTLKSNACEPTVDADDFPECVKFHY